MAKPHVYLASRVVDATGATALLDERGQPVSARVSDVLVRLAPKFARMFASFRDEDRLVEALERAAQRIRRREARRGEVDSLEGYAWVTLVSVANSTLRNGRARIDRMTTIGLCHSERNVPSAGAGSVDAIERSVLMAQLLARLTPRERVICEWQLEGLTSQEIAARLGCSAGAVDVMMTRARQRLRMLVSSTESARPQPSQSDRSASGRRSHSDRVRKMHSVNAVPTFTPVMRSRTERSVRKVASDQAETKHGVGMALALR